MVFTMGHFLILVGCIICCSGFPTNGHPMFTGPFDQPPHWVLLAFVLKGGFPLDWACACAHNALQVLGRDESSGINVGLETMTMHSICYNSMYVLIFRQSQSGEDFPEDKTTAERSYWLSISTAHCSNEFTGPVDVPASHCGPFRLQPKCSNTALWRDRRSSVSYQVER